MRGQYIDGISSYCDRWCERCAFTERCSARAVEVAMSMCDGDFEAAVELAVGAPPPMNEAERKRRQAFLESLPDGEPTAEETDAWEREEEAREARIEESPITTQAETVWLLSHQWLSDHRERLEEERGPALAEALEIASWDCHFIRVKLQRALAGRDEAQHGESWPDDDPVQNDWNGTAKVALISIARSIEAWDAISRSTGDPDATHIASELRKLQEHVEAGFPNAHRFRRPGFDGIPRRRRWRRG